MLKRIALWHQHPPSEAPPKISVTFAEPPSVEGTAGPQTGEGAPGAVAVAFAPCVEVPGASPGNCRDDSGLMDDGALIAADAAAPAVPIVPVCDPVIDPSPPVAEPCEDDRDEVGTLNGSEPTAVPLALVWLLSCGLVWA